MARVVSLVEDSKEDERISNDQLFNISSWGADLSFREILMMYEENELVKPELQRNYVWTKLEASRFIDSILLGLPVPSIFFAKMENEQKLIIDGYQRIMTVKDFVSGIFSGNNESFKLSNTNSINRRWRNKTFAELTDTEKIRIKATTIHAIIFEQREPDDNSGMYQIFERINTGGKTLKSQEIRNCIYQGDMNNLLIELNGHPLWRQILMSNKVDPRMLDIELILRFFSMHFLYNNRPDTHTINLTNYMNDFMFNKKLMNEEEKQNFANTFSNMLEKVFELFGNAAFRKPSQSNRKSKVNPVLFDAISIATIKAIENNIDFPDRIAVTKNYNLLFDNEDFINMISKRTTNIENIIGRIDYIYHDVYGG